jgi:hypothetical protein
MYFSLPKLTSCTFSNWQSDSFTQPNAVRICEKFAILILWKSSSSQVTLFKFICASTQVSNILFLTFVKFLNFGFQILLLFLPEICTSFNSYVVQIICINLPWILSPLISSPLPLVWEFWTFFIELVGWDGAVGVATRYRLNGPGIEFLWGWNFPHPSRPTLGSTQPPVQWIPSLFPGGKAAGSWRWPPTVMAPKLKKEYSYIFALPLGLHGLLYGECYLYLDQTVSYVACVQHDVDCRSRKFRSLVLPSSIYFHGRCRGFLFFTWSPSSTYRSR